LIFIILALSLLMGTTLLDSTTIIAHSPTIGLSYPYTILVNKTADNSIIVTSQNTKQVIGFYDMVSSMHNVTLIAQNWSGGNQLGLPFGLAIPPNNKSLLYVSDQNNQSVYKIVNMQVVSPTPTIVAGVKSGSGSSAINKFNGPVGIAVDSNGSLYVADSSNHRIIRFPPTSTSGSSGTVVAGLGTSGSNSFSLSYPYGIFLDEINSYMYVADAMNHRIQRFPLFGGSPNNGTTVAGNNGPGTASNQFFKPFSLYVTKTTQTMYIADSFNNRVQRWVLGEQSGVTIAGDPGGNPGSNASMFNNVYGLTVNDEETFLYAADSGNSRLQRFELV
jgi:sugar lactone lactonase YvrE